MRISFSVIFLLVLTSCTYFKSEKKQEAIARVGEHYLYKSDIIEIVPKGTSKEDSIVFVHNFINRWASQKLMLETALRNLSDNKLKEYDELIEQYKNDLYTKAYLEEKVKTSIDTVVTETTLKEYYEKQKENFKLSETLVRLQYLNVNKDHPKLVTIKDKFFSYSNKDKKFWDVQSLQFKSFAFNDTVWVSMQQVYDKLPIVTPENKDEIIRQGQKSQILDNNDLYLIKVVQVLNKNQVSPYNYIKPTLKEFIINQRKLEMMKKIEKDLTNDAIKNKEYEIYK
jgi:hypothetical protein